VNTHEEWIVLGQQRWEDRWLNARMWYPGIKSINDRFCKTEEEAHKVLENAYRKWNGKKVYNADGKRSELVDSVNGIGVSLVSDREQDHLMEIVAYKIRKRIVTDWETIEEA
jgi:hypothetical protein